jgi:hypothetical protein
LDAQIDALSQSLRIKLEQAANKILQGPLRVQSDSIRVVAARTELKVARDQLKRGEQQFTGRPDQQGGTGTSPRAGATGQRHLHRCGE